MNDQDHAAIAARWRARLVVRRQLVATARKRYIWHPTVENRRKLEIRRQQVAYAQRVIKRHAGLAARNTLQERAYREASKLIGVTEQGGNNRGPGVEVIIKEGGGLPGQAWCGWFMACVYKRAGSKAPDWHWGAVRLYVPLSGVSVTKRPVRGDLVRFTFDHIGMFVKDNGDGTITTIEGNTGNAGARSDSVTGGDGVKAKVRHKSLVRDYLHITR